MSARPPLVIRHRDGWWFWHCRPCGETNPNGIVTQPAATEAAITHLTTHARTVGFASTARTP